MTGENAEIDFAQAGSSSCEKKKRRGGKTKMRVRKQRRYSKGESDRREGGRLHEARAPVREAHRHRRRVFPHSAGSHSGPG